jgi:hypothetical protein
MQLYKINQNGNKYCGPSVVSALAGIGTKEAATVIRSQNGRSFIKSSTTDDVACALRLLGFEMALVGYSSRADRVTLRQWASTHARAKNVYLVVARRHWILVQGRTAMCGKTIDLVHVGAHPNAMAFVTEAHKITRVQKVDAITVIPRSAKMPISGHAKAKRLAREFCIDIEKNKAYRDFMVYPPASLNEAEDPHQGDHYCSDWADVLAMVEEYVKILQASELDKVVSNLLPPQPSEACG